MDAHSTSHREWAPAPRGVPRPKEEIPHASIHVIYLPYNMKRDPKRDEGGGGGSKGDRRGGQNPNGKDKLPQLWGIYRVVAQSRSEKQIVQPTKVPGKRGGGGQRLSEPQQHT